MRAGTKEETTRGGLSGWRCGSSSACRCAVCVCVFALCCRLSCRLFVSGRGRRAVSAFFVTTCAVLGSTRWMHWLRLMPSLVLLLLPVPVARMVSFVFSFAACCCWRLSWFCIHTHTSNQNRRGTNIYIILACAFSRSTPLMSHPQERTKGKEGARSSSIRPAAHDGRPQHPRRARDARRGNDLVPAVDQTLLERRFRRCKGERSRARGPQRARGRGQRAQAVGPGRERGPDKPQEAHHGGPGGWLRRRER